MQIKNKTNAMRLLDKYNVAYTVRDYTQTDAISGMDVAAVLSEEPETVFKTLVTVGKSGAHYVFLVPVNKELDQKKAAHCVGEKAIDMVKSKDLLPLTGYIHGGCSPLGMKKEFRTVLDESAARREILRFSGGKIGYQIELRFEDLDKALKFELSPITAD